MPELDQLLRRAFGASRPGARRLRALGPAHAVHEAGYDVAYSRYSVAYREAGRAVTLAAELDEDGVLAIRAAGAPKRIRARIARALDFLEAPHRFED